MFFLIGGGLDLTKDKRILRKLLSLSRGDKICLITTASEAPEETALDFLEAFINIGVRQVSFSNPRLPEEAEIVPVSLEGCDIVFFTGGDQLILANALRDSRFLEAIVDIHRSGGIIAGTSAGASALSNNMIYGPEDWTVGKAEDLVSLEKGLGLLPGLVIDTHFSERSRLLRLKKILPKGCTGIGIDEDTATIIKETGEIEIFGAGKVFIVTGNEVKILKSGQTDYLHAICAESTMETQ